MVEQNPEVPCGFIESRHPSVPCGCFESPRPSVPVFLLRVFRRSLESRKRPSALEGLAERLLFDIKKRASDLEGNGWWGSRSLDSGIPFERQRGLAGSASRISGPGKRAKSFPDQDSFV
jgi:hypothetical protein